MDFLCVQFQFTTKQNNILFLLIERIIVSRETIIIVNQNGLLS